VTRRSVILDATVRLVFDAALVLSLYLLFAGHNQPGGGFVGGLVAGAALALRFLAGGVDELRGLLPVRPWSLSAAGLMVVAMVALVPALVGGPPLDHEVYGVDLVLAGHMEFNTAVVFDAGVYLIVVGMVATMLEAFGDEVDR